jgi:hypothetical protein
VSRAPHKVLPVLSENVVDHLVEYVFGRLADEAGVGIERLIRFEVETRPMPHKLLAAGARFDQSHSGVPPVTEMLAVGILRRHAALP